MTNKEMAERFRNAAEYLNKARTDMLNKADELDPPRPEPGTVVFFDDDHDPGIVTKNGIVYAANEEPAIAYWEDIPIPFKPARILMSREVMATIPDVSEWPKDSKYCEVAIVFDRHDNSRRVQRVITRAEAEAMDAENE